MIELRKYLYESLLDDEEDLISDDDSVILTSSEFKSHYSSKYDGEIKNNTLIYDGQWEEVETDGTSLSNIFSSAIDTINVPSGNITIRDDKPVSPDTLCKNINCKYFSGITTNGASNINMSVTAASFLSDKPIELNNVNFNFLKLPGPASQLTLSVEKHLPVFNNVNITPSDCILNLSDNGLGLKKTTMAKIIEKYMDLSYTPSIVTRLGQKEIKSDLKTLAKYINMQGITTNGKLFKIKDNVKITDFFPNFPKEFKTIQVTGHLIKITFYHPDSMNIYTQATKDEFLSGKQVNQLSDGWIMQITKW